MKNRWLLGAAAAALISIMGTAPDARACGGCFHEPLPPTQTGTVVTDHRMIFSIATQQTTLYDEIKYAGTPSSFAWVLPIRGLVTVGLSSELVFSALESATATQIVAPPLTCPVCGCRGGPVTAAGGGGFSADASAAADSGVTVLSQQTIGPYAAVQLQSTDPMALETWLAANGYVIPADIQPVISAYVTEGFDFLALRLRPGQGVQAMRPVRVTSPGAGLSLPLRMVAAGTGATVGITLWVVADGRYEPMNFPFFTILPSELTWDWAMNSSTYTTLRVQKEAADNNAAWQVESSLVLSPFQIEAPVLNSPNDYMPLPTASATDGGGAAVDAGSMTAARTADLAALFPEGNVSMRITRMRGDLLHSALANDLVLQASADQSTLSNVYQVTKSVNAPPCPSCPCGGSSSGGVVGAVDAGASSGAMASNGSGGVMSSSGVVAAGDASVVEDAGSASSSGALSSSGAGSSGATSSSGAMNTGGSGSSSGGAGAANGSGAVADSGVSPAPVAHESSGCAAITSDPDDVAVQLMIGGLVGVSILRTRRGRAKKVPS